jgi:segregation and condensation protein B
MKRLPALNRDTLAPVIESILFVTEEPVEVGTLVRTLNHSRAEVENALTELEQRCESGGTRVQRDGDLVQLVTAPDYGPYVERYLGLEARQLSGAALESLAIIAYKQPVTRAGVEAVRGVNSDAAIASLLGRGLIEEVGKATTPGRPTLLGTTLKFLEHFGLRAPSDMPALPGVTDRLDREEWDGGPNGQASLFNPTPMLAPNRAQVAVLDPSKDDADDDGDGEDGDEDEVEDPGEPADEDIDEAPVYDGSEDDDAADNASEDDEEPAGPA